MIKFDLNKKDLGADAVVNNGQVLIGDSSLRILEHRLLEFGVFIGPERIHIYNREAIGPAKNAIVTASSNRAIDASLRELASFPNAYLSLEILRGPEFHCRIQLGGSISNQLYVAASKTRLSGSWSFLDVAKVFPNFINEEYLATWLTMNPEAYSSETLFSNVHRIPINSECTITDSFVRITSKDGRQSFFPRKLNQKYKPSELVFDQLTESLSRRSIAEKNIAVEVSGGLDSSVSALAASVVCGQVTAASLSVLDAQYENQSSRQTVVSSTLGIPHIIVNAAEYLPFSPEGDRATGLSVSYFTETFHEAYKALAAQLTSGGVDTVISGIGGDEAFPLFADEAEVLAKVAPPFSLPFLRARSYDAAAATKRIHHYFSTYHSSALLGASYRTERLFSQGIWPINPFLDQEMIQLGSSLPLNARTDRAVLKEILLANGMAEFGNYLPRSFEPIAMGAFRRANWLLPSLCQDSVSERLGLIDSKELLEMYERLLMNGQTNQYHEYCMHGILFFIHIECFMQNCRAEGVEIMLH